MNNLHLSGGTVDLMIGTDFAQAFSGMLVISAKSREPISKLIFNCGWYVIGTFARQHNQRSGRVSSVVAKTVSVLEDIKKLLAQNLMGVRPNEICTCRDTNLQGNKFIKLISEFSKIVEKRILVRIPWKKDRPPNENNYNLLTR